MTAAARIGIGIGLVAAVLAPRAGCAADLAPALAARPAAGPDDAIWAGPYLGLEGSAGGSFGGFDFDRATIGARPAGRFRTGDATGRNDTGTISTTAIGGAFGGYNWQVGPYVYGLDLALDGANLKRPVPSSVAPLGYADFDPFSPIRTKTNVLGTARGRLGFAFERYLVYATFGLAGADVRFLSDFPDPATGLVARARAGRSYLGLTLGAGIEYAIAPGLSLGIDYRAIDFGERRVGLGTLPGALGGPVFARAAFTSNEVMARLSWHPGGLALPPDVEEVAPHDPGDGGGDRLSLHGQTTYIAQGVPGFHSPYVGPQSFLPHQARSTLTATAFVGLKLTDSTELYVNPEFNQGFGLSRTTGIAGFVNGEAQKAGSSNPRLRAQRYYVRQTFGLGGETETVPDGPNQVAMTRDVERVSVIAGKFALGDFFDGNVYAHDPRVDFMNWSLWESSAYDFPANLPGFTQGVIVEYNRREFALRAAYTQVPKEPSNDVLDPRVLRKGGFTAEFEGRYALPLSGQPGKLRLGVFSNTGRTANYREAVALAALDPVAYADANEAALATRRDRTKTGVYANLEQAITPELGAFARVSASDGRNESLSFTDVDRSASAGLSLKGVAWNRPDDTVGLGGAVNAITRAHRDFLAAGGRGLLVGDGILPRYGLEQAFETYYALSLTKAVTLSFDYQFVRNPGYNRDRGPANVFATRLHADF